MGAITTLEEIAMKKAFLKSIVSIVLILTLMLCVGVACAKENNDPENDPTKVEVTPAEDTQPVDPNAPVYTGMTLTSPDASHASLAAALNNGMTQLSSITKLNQSTAAIPDVYQDTDLVISIHFDNPLNYEILSFTINDTKYSSYMFEDGSTMSCISIKFNVGSDFGEKECTIAAIKYVDGTQIKDVVLKGDQTAKINVYGFEKEETVDGLTYKFYSNKTASLSNVPQTLEEVMIPAKIGDYTVTSIEDHTFRGHYGSHTIVYLPETLIFTGIEMSQFAQGTESRTVYVLGTTESVSIGACHHQYTGIAYENLVKVDDCYYIISEQGASLIRYVGSGTSTYYVPNSITVNGKSVNVFAVAAWAFRKQLFSSDICDYVFNP